MFSLTWRKVPPKGKCLQNFCIRGEKFQWTHPILKSGLCTTLHCFQSKHVDSWIREGTQALHSSA